MNLRKDQSKYYFIIIHFVFDIINIQIQQWSWEGMILIPSIDRGYCLNSCVLVTKAKPNFSLLKMSKNLYTTISGGSLGSQVDEERS